MGSVTAAIVVLLYEATAQQLNPDYPDYDMQKLLC